MVVGFLSQIGILNFSLSVVWFLIWSQGLMKALQYEEEGVTLGDRQASECIVEFKGAEFQALLQCLPE